MTEQDTHRADESLVREYLAALGNGHVLDALNAFSLDARMRDEAGRERRGIREIAATFASREQPVQVDIEDLQRKGEAVAVRVRMTFAEGRGPREYRTVFRVSRNRIRSLEMDLVPAPLTSRRRHGHPA